MLKVFDKIDPSWKDALSAELQKEYFSKLLFFLEKEDSTKIIYPEKSKRFLALELTSLPDTQVVIIGQDPYHGPGQAHGLSFSVEAETRLPPSLKNIFTELKDDLGIDRRQKGNLSAWATQGVLLLNAVLTVEEAQAGSHRQRGWETFTDEIIGQLSEKGKGIVFILWGSYAKKKKQLIDLSKHFIIESAHPSPLSSYRGFFGSKPFSKTNEILKSQNKSPIDWAK